MASITINGSAFEISPSLAGSIGDALLHEIDRCARLVVAHDGASDPMADWFEPSSESRAARDATAADGMTAVRMHAALFGGYTEAQIEARWQIAIETAQAKAA